MRKLKLRIGGAYISRDGTEVSTIVRTALPTDPAYRKTHRFVDQEGYAYMSDGRTHPTKDYPFDLVDEIKSKPHKSKPKQ